MHVRKASPPAGFSTNSPAITATRDQLLLAADLAGLAQLGSRKGGALGEGSERTLDESEYDDARTCGGSRANLDVGNSQTTSGGIWRQSPRATERRA